MTVAKLEILDVISSEELLFLFVRHMWSMQQRGRKGNVSCEYEKKEKTTHVHKCTVEDLRTESFCIMSQSRHQREG